MCNPGDRLSDKFLYGVETMGMAKGKGKGHPITGHEGPEGEYRYSLSLSLTSALGGGG